VQGSDLHVSSSGAMLNYRDINMKGYSLTIDGNIRMDTTINVNGGKLTVNGTLHQTDGTLNVNMGRVSITDNYYILGSGSNFESGKESYAYSTGYLKMVYEADEVCVGSSLITNSAHEHDEYLTAGTLYVGGDFTQLDTSGYSYDYCNFAAQAGHKTVLNGSGEQVISFASAYSGFGTLAATNGQLVFKNNVNWLVQGSDLHVSSSGAMLNYRDINMKGYSLTIDGNIRMDTTINVNGGKMTVNGTLHQTDGTLNVNLGSVNITDNYYIVGPESNFESGKENYTACYGCLKMVYEADEVRVGGSIITKAIDNHWSYLTAGTLYVGGDFTQLDAGSYTTDAYNFAAQSGHKTVLNGSNEQVISFASGDSGFGTLSATNDQIVFKNNVNWLVQGSDLHVSSSGAMLNYRDINMKGYSLTIDGRIRMNTNINVNGGKLTVNGTLQQTRGILNVNLGSVSITDNYYIVGPESNFESGKENYTACYGCLKMVYEADEVRVGGSVITKAIENHQSYLTAGTLYVGGDFTQLDAGSYTTDAYNFAAQSGHKTVLNGNGKQRISFVSTSSHFGTLELTKPLINYTFTPDKCWITRIEAPITPVILPAMLNEIAEEAFLNDTNLMVVQIDGSNMTTIGGGAFRGCANLYQITLPSSVVVIADDAFDGCALLTIICDPDSYARQYADDHGIDWLAN